MQLLSTYELERELYLQTILELVSFGISRSASGGAVQVNGCTPRIDNRPQPEEEESLDSMDEILPPGLSHRLASSDGFGGLGSLAT